MADCHGYFAGWLVSVSCEFSCSAIGKTNSGQILKNEHGKYFGHTIIVKTTLCYFWFIVTYCPIDKVEEFDATTKPL